MTLPYVFVFNYIGSAPGKEKQMNLSALAVVRSLGRRGIPVILITTNTSDSVAKSKYVKKVELCPYMHESEEKVFEFFFELSRRYPGEKVLMPTVDECAWFVGKHHDRLSLYYLIPAPNSQAMNKVNNKRFQYETAEQLGIPIPETYFPHTVEEVKILSRTIFHYPYVIKPNISFQWKLTSARSSARGKKGLRVNNAEELVKTAEEIFVPGQEFMIQELIGGRDQRLVTFLGFFAEDYQPVSWFIRKKIRQSPIDFGYCTMTESCHDPVVLDQSVRLLKAVYYHGIAGIEWKLDPATGTYKLIEINGRPVNTTGCAIAAGVDLPAIAYFHAIGRPLPPVTNWQDGQRWAWLAMDFWAAKELASLGQGTLKQWWRETRSIKADAVFAKDDLWLSLSYYAVVLWNSFTAKAKKTFYPEFILLILSII
jgi:D-aspartate ligase